MAFKRGGVIARVNRTTRKDEFRGHEDRPCPTLAHQHLGPHHRADRHVHGQPKLLARRAGEAIEAGARILGENYIQEAQKKIEILGAGVSWHFIGHLQKNKAKYAVRLFDLIHAVDDFALAEELNRTAEKNGKTQEILLQADLSGEATKFGAAEGEILKMAERVAALKNVSVRGLMTMPPWFPDAEAARPFFRALRELRDRIADRRIPGVEMMELSMGMSDDFVVAGEEGATIVRIGRAIFGKRPLKSL